MSKLRIIFIASLIILGALVAITMFRPMVSSETFSAVTRESVIQKESECIIQFDIINREGKVANYIINWATGGETYSSKEVSIGNGRSFTNIHHVYPQTVKEGKVNLTICKEGEDTHFEECTYYIRFD